jgi:hippurate hydrolase
VVESLKLCDVDEIKSGIRKTSVVTLILGKKAASSEMLGLPADMDARPIMEQNDFACESTRPGMMHGCGHDMHTAMRVGAARYLGESTLFDDTAVLIFQPGEEGFAGAKAMIEDGVFDRLRSSRRMPCTTGR